MDSADIDQHPDLVDPRWLRRVERTAKREIRRSKWRARRNRIRFRARPSRHRALLAIVVVSTAVSMLIGAYTGGFGGLVPPLAGAVPLRAAATPTTTATSRVRSRIDLNQPFADTPAAGWSDGEQGIAPPPAAAVGTHSAAEIADVTARVQRVLVAAHLDRRVLVDHDPSGYLALFARDDAAALASAFQPGHERDATSFITEIAAGHPLLPAPPKVNGTMTVALDRDGTLLVHTNYVFAYAFAGVPPDRMHDPMDIVAVQHFRADFRWVTGRAAPGGIGLWHDTVAAYTYSMDCAASLRGFLAPGGTRAATGPGPGDSSNPDTFFDPAHRMNITDGCPDGATTPPTTTPPAPPTIVTA